MVESRENCPLLFLSSFSESLIDDVIGMTHRKKVFEQILQIRKLMEYFRENHLSIVGAFYGDFKKSSEFRPKIKIVTVSLSSRGFPRTVGFSTTGVSAGVWWGCDDHTGYLEVHKTRSYLMLHKLCTNLPI